MNAFLCAGAESAMRSVVELGTPDFEALSTGPVTGSSNTTLTPRCQCVSFRESYNVQCVISARNSRVRKRNGRRNSE